MAPPIRLIFLGTGDFALPSFEHLVETGHDVSALVTQPDRPQGRKQELIPSRIKLAAQSRGIRVEQPEDVNAAESLDDPGDAAGSPRHGRLRPDPLRRPPVDPQARRDQPSWLGPPVVSGCGAGRARDPEWRDSRPA